MTSKQLGNIGEVKTIYMFVKSLIPIYTPFGDNERSDLIAEFKGKLNRIQVKTSENIIDNKMTFSLISSTTHRSNGVKHKYTSDEIDYFALYNLEMDILLLIPIEEVEGRSTISFRIPYQSSRNQYKSYNYEDYLFNKMI